jgi:aspartyl aminopeptidase
LVAAELERQGATTPPDNVSEIEGSDDSFSPLKSMKERHHPRLIELIAEAAEATPDQVEDFELVR